MIGLFLTSQDCPKFLGKNGSQGPKKKDFEKLIKFLVSMHPIFWSKLSQIVLGENGSQEPKKRDLKK